MSTTARLRARRSNCEQAGKKREHQRATIVTEREQKSPMMASTAADKGKPLQLSRQPTGAAYPGQDAMAPSNQSPQSL